MAQNKDGKVVGFIRKGGRVIPIRGRQMTRSESAAHLSKSVGKDTAKIGAAVGATVGAYSAAESISKQARMFKAAGGKIGLKHIAKAAGAGAAMTAGAAIGLGALWGLQGAAVGAAVGAVAPIRRLTLGKARKAK